MRWLCCVVRCSYAAEKHSGMGKFDERWRGNEALKGLSYICYIPVYLCVSGDEYCRRVVCWPKTAILHDGYKD